MATTYKVLGQSAPAAATDTNLYTVPAGAQAVISTVNVCNRGTSSATFRIAVRPGGATLANQHYQSFDVPIDANAIIPITIGMTMGAGDVLTVRSSTANLSFSSFGTEVTP